MDDLRKFQGRWNHGAERQRSYIVVVATKLASELVLVEIDIHHDSEKEQQIERERETKRLQSDLREEEGKGSS